MTHSSACAAGMDRRATRISRRRVLPAIAVALLIPLLMPPAAVRAQSDGVVPAAVRIDTLFAIGRPDGPEEEFLARDRRGGGILLDVGPDGLIWIVNPIDGHLLVFNSAGERLKIFSRKGSGPGEYKSMLALTAVTGGAWTWDWYNQQLCLWSVTQGLLETHRTNLPQPLMNRIVVDRRGTLWFLQDIFEESERERVPVELRCVEPGGDQMMVTTFMVPGATAKGWGSVLSYIPPYAPLPDGGIVISPTHEYDLFGYASDAEEAVVHWHFPSTETSYTARQRRPGGRGGFTPAGGDMIEPPLLSHQPDLADIQPAGCGAYWILTPVRSEDGQKRIDYIDCDGNRLGSYWFPSRTGTIRGTLEQPVALAWTPEGYQVFGLRITVEER